MTNLPLGPLMIDVAGLELTAAERERLAHPLIGGVILFKHNYRDPQQLTALCAAIHDIRQPALPIAIDHEGGRVQRCREGFTHVPPMRRLGDLWDSDPAAARQAAADLGYLLAAELRACGVDYSFTPVLDLDWGPSGGRRPVEGSSRDHDPRAVHPQGSAGQVRAVQDPAFVLHAAHLLFL